MPRRLAVIARRSPIETPAVIIDTPRRLALGPARLTAPGRADVVVEIALSGISTGTERLFWEGRMPPFPGMGYPLVPGYESVGEVVESGPESGLRVGERVFVPGANCYEGLRGLFGGAARLVVVPGRRLHRVDAALGADAALFALAATARRALCRPGADLPELIIGHGVLGRLLARICAGMGGAPVVWESDPGRRDGACGYEVLAPEADERRDYRVICDASGRADLVPEMISRLGRGGEIVLAGFYSDPIAFAFAPAFLKEARLRVSAEWDAHDMEATRALVGEGVLSLGGLITHARPAAEAAEAYATAFGDPACLKMILDWRDVA